MGCETRLIDSRVLEGGAEERKRIGGVLTCGPRER